MRRAHIDAKRRTVLREDALPLTGESEALLAERLADISSPSNQMLRQEVEQRVRLAIHQLPEGDRDVIILKHLEELSFEETAAVLEITTTAVYSRYYRAIERLHRFLHESDV
jgi:RNA polymerase sigma-70 factor (ECF subfamily)